MKFRRCEIPKPPQYDELEVVFANYDLEDLKFLAEKKEAIINTYGKGWLQTPEFEKLQLALGVVERIVKQR